MNGKSLSLDEHLAAIVRDAVRTELTQIVHAEIQAALGKLGDPGAQKPYLDVAEAAEAAHCHPQTIRLYIKRGQLACKRIGNRVLISRTDLDEFLSS